ncbi:MAG: TrkA family potassium uptake protein [Rhizobiales bacterium]|nr:TrkA family potassium uptake protein [Hyphomicrobiales bacterium]
MAVELRSFVVIGLGTFGSTVASELTDYGNPVLGIDIDEQAVSNMADILQETVIADARNEKALRDAGVGQCDVAVVAIGEDLEANIVCAMNVKLIGVKQIWAKAMTRTHHRILARLGVDRVVHAEREMGQRIAEMLHNPMVRDYVSIGNGFYVVNIIVPEDIAGQTLSSLQLGERFELRCLEVMRGSRSILKDTGDPELEEGDHLLVLGRRAKLRDFSDSL